MEHDELYRCLLSAVNNSLRENVSILCLSAAEAERMQTSGSSSSRTSTMSREYDPSKREMVDSAIRDIKTAIEKSKNMQLKSPREERERGEEPIWVMR